MNLVPNLFRRGSGSPHYTAVSSPVHHLPSQASQAALRDFTATWRSIFSWSGLASGCCACNPHNHSISCSARLDFVRALIDAERCLLPTPGSSLSACTCSRCICWQWPLRVSYITGLCKPLEHLLEFSGGVPVHVRGAIPVAYVPQGHGSLDATSASCVTLPKYQRHPINMFGFIWDLCPHDATRYVGFHVSLWRWQTVAPGTRVPGILQSDVCNRCAYFS